MNAESETVVVFGRRYSTVTISDNKEGEKLANALMAVLPQLAVLVVRDGHIYLAEKTDEGIPV